MDFPPSPSPTSQHWWCDWCPVPFPSAAGMLMSLPASADFLISISISLSADKLYAGQVVAVTVVPVLGVQQGPGQQNPHSGWDQVLLWPLGQGDSPGLLLRPSVQAAVMAER